MIILSYDKARKSLLMMAIYLICTSIVFKFIGLAFEYNFQSLLGSVSFNQDFNLSLPTFNFDTMSFEWIIESIRAKINEILQLILPATVGFVDLTFFNSLPNQSALTHKGISYLFKA